MVGVNDIFSEVLRHSSAPQEKNLCLVDPDNFNYNIYFVFFDKFNF